MRSTHSDKTLLKVTNYPKTANPRLGPIRLRFSPKLDWTKFYKTFAKLDIKYWPPETWRQRALALLRAFPFPCFLMFFFSVIFTGPKTFVASFFFCCSCLLCCCVYLAVFFSFCYICRSCSFHNLVVFVVFCLSELVEF